VEQNQAFQETPNQSKINQTEHPSPDPFVLNLLETVESELRTHGIEVIRPQPGDEADVAVMKFIDHLPCPFWRKKDRIARVHSCGAALRQENDTHMLRKSTVTIYR